MEIGNGSFVNFMGSKTTPTKAQITILGVPFDGTTSFIPGSRFAPARIREVSYSLETYSPTQERDLEEIAFFDQGDVDLPLGNTPVALERIEQAVCSIYDNGSMPLVIGGEHLISLPVIRAARTAFPDLVVLHFDAHTDLRDNYLGEQDSHATVMRRVTDLIRPENLYQFGIRSGLREEFNFAKANIHFFPGDFNRQNLLNVAEEIKSRPVYVSIDIDVIDPAFAPGTGTPEPDGWHPRQLLDALEILSSLDIVGSDLVEVCPLAEHGFITSILGAKIIREMLLYFNS